MTCPTKEQLARYIDHSLLNPLATRSDIEEHCADAVEHDFYAVCVLGRWVSLAADILRGTKVKVVGTAGFPFGTDMLKIKSAQAKALIMAGADEIDMVADLAAIVEGQGRNLAADIGTVLGQCRSVRPRVGLKVIIESGSLTDKQIIFACGIAEAVGADFVKTGTGLFGMPAATVEAVKLMNEHLTTCRIKAAGGIATAREAIDMIDAGATRIGSSRSIEILNSFPSEDADK